jgi:prepilin-type N-terminal cleavage/methylation domain-containing protein
MQKIIDSDSDGFTLIELIIVIAIMGILLTIGIPQFLGFLSSARVATDKQNLKVLNQTTIYYAITQRDTSDDVFEGISTDEERMETLVSANCLQAVIEPKVADQTFTWSVDNQTWLYSLLEVATVSTKSIDFTTLTSAELDTYTKTNTWNLSSSGVSSSYGRLFIPNPNDEYTITSTATLSGSGGYGVFIETSYYVADDTSVLDSGYAVQFDKSRGGIVIKQREDSKESDVSKSLVSLNGTTVNGVLVDDAWWSQEHNISVKVEDVEGKTGTKKVSVIVDNQNVMENFEIASTTASENNFTGIRAWGSTTTVKDLSVN